ncbi:hypothetical protein [Sphingomonas sp. M1-B02]|uniref:hypothetical protein n=1 Tax=Sphingomonas sp. M1-B02 TaxID=3114300 RepID=UPI0022403D45|nr:hypothetical protein [Sphingomonas sp. S6-11]UZK65066.1 hypothetical protein OKW87_11125 [Sphingomonas sp. S6-11]
MSVLLLELNEINFDDVRRYVAMGFLPTLGALIAKHGVSETTSEREYDELEPWIQWVTAHSGLSLADHGVFRLGDILAHDDIVQIWEVLEAQGLSVGAISPMNASNRCVDPAFFVPDPWTAAKVSGPNMLKRLYAPIAQAVNDNATGRITARSAVDLILGLLAYARPANYTRYVALVAAAAKGDKWAKAMFLDTLLADVFIRSVAKSRPQFASLFLNAGAHIQHHYLFNSKVYEGEGRNPDWYVAADRDPVLEVYSLYDRTVAQIIAAFPQSRILMATGLHQNPHGTTTFYWRIRDHESFLKTHDVPFERVEPRMSRDFLIYCRDADEALRAEARLAQCVGESGERLFSVDNRGDSLFVMLSWPHDIPTDFTYRVGNSSRGGLRDSVSFVAIKNGEHDGVGYFIDTGVDEASERFALADLPRRIAEACGATWHPPGAPAQA